MRYAVVDLFTLWIEAKMKCTLLTALAVAFALSSPSSASEMVLIFSPNMTLSYVKHDPCALDTDSDRLADCDETEFGTSLTDIDTDGDGLSDGDEVLGTPGGLDLPAMGVNPLRKDILLEYDWYVDSSEGTGGGKCQVGQSHSHRPTQAMLDIVTVMFGAAPVANPNNQSGINVIHDFGQGGVFTGGGEIIDANGDGMLPGDVNGAEYDNHYNQDFSLNRKGYFHYVVLPHRYNNGSNSSGYAELGYWVRRDEMIVSLNCSDSAEFIAFTIAHELGHNLYLDHGGDAPCNGKPNYNSVMNYRFQFDGVDLDCNVSPDGVGDFSAGGRITLDENELVETAGVCGSQAVDWNESSSIDGGEIQVDINNWGERTYEGNQPLRCGGTHTLLSDFDDWGNIVLNMEPFSPMSKGLSPIKQESVYCPGPPSK